jgi:hypothetical protein
MTWQCIKQSIWFRECIWTWAVQSHHAGSWSMPHIPLAMLSIVYKTREWYLISEQTTGGVSQPGVQLQVIQGLSWRMSGHSVAHVPTASVSSPVMHCTTDSQSLGPNTLFFALSAHSSGRQPGGAAAAGQGSRARPSANTSPLQGCNSSLQSPRANLASRSYVLTSHQFLSEPEPSQSHM